jgi:hypothetical protein
MKFPRRLLGLFAAVLAACYALGSSGAALACASPAATMSAPMPAGMPCQGDNKAHDCALACAPMCTALVPALAEVTPPPLPEAVLLSGETVQLASASFRPDPPPPRLGSI